ncbi:APC family permease [Candidatus Babeliales bacterium]|nr:APC family permease [Candidatus Babeliales bacterium]
MTKQQTIPFWIAVIININIVIGAAFFLGAQSITLKSGIFSPFAWLFCGLLLLPLVAVFAWFAKRHPEAGGLYVYSQKSLGSFWGFLSGWGYFVGTTAGNAAVIHAFSSYLQNVASVHRVLLPCGLLGLKFDLLLVLFFTLLNVINIQFMERAQIFFVVMKMIPMLVLVVGALFVGTGTSYVAQAWDFSNFFETIPMVFFAYVGFEACCAVADKIGDSQRKASAVIWSSFGIIMLVYVVLQFCALRVQGSFDVNPFLHAIGLFTSDPVVADLLSNIVYATIMLSFLGGFYGMYFYNSWNLYAIAQDKNIIGGSYLTKLTKNQIPWVCLMVQCFLLSIFLLLTTADSYLVVIGDFGVTIGYLLTTVAFFVASKNKIVALAALLSCSFLLYLCSKSLVDAGMYNLIPLLIVLGIGIIVYKGKQFLNQQCS